MTSPAAAGASGSADTRGSHDWILAQAERLKATGETEPRFARDPVNQPQIHTWLEAIGDPNPVYRDTPEAASVHGGPVAPPAMAQVWTMHGLGLPGGRHRGSDRGSDPLHRMMGVLDEAGFTSVLGTNCDQTYDRYLRPGERVSVTTRLESVVGPKKTGVGEGYFVTTRSIWRVGDERVATMMFRVLKYQPRATAKAASDVTDPSRTVRPVVNRDSAYFWEGTQAGELRIQRCASCGTLRHPPGPLCPACHSTDKEWVVVPGAGTVFSYVVHHAPQIPGKQLPLTIAVVELEDGLRMIGELHGVSEPEIGLPVVVRFDRVDDELTLPNWVAAGAGPGAGAESALAHRNDRAREATVGDSGAQAPARQELPGWELPITPTLVVSTALATRDFQDVHHDPELARGHGSQDIFLNILTTTGLVQRFVGEWAGRAATIRACELRLGAPAYPGDTLAFSGSVSGVVEVDGEQRHVVDVVGQVSLGAHVTARVSVVLPEVSTSSTAEEDR
jgi:uncharacterized OB-fold protein